MRARQRTGRDPRPSAWSRRVVVATALAALLASACAAGGPTSPARPTSALGGATADPGDIDPALLEPLTALGPCEVDPNAVDAPAVDGLVLPPDAVLTEQTEDGPLTTAQGYVPMTPVQLRVWYQRHDDLEVVQIEDEIREAEALLDHGDRRLFVKAQAVCELGSIFIAVVAPRAAQDQVPAPAGGAGG